MADDNQREVLSSLPRSRPVRRSRKRGEAPAAGRRDADGSARSGGSNATPATRAKKSASKPKTAAKEATAKPAAKKAKPAAAKKSPARKTAAKAKPKTAAAKRSPARKTAAKAKPRAAARTGATDGKAQRPTPISAAPTAQARRAQKPKTDAPPAGWATPEDAGGKPPSGVEIVTTGVRAVGELAQLGGAVAGQAVKGLLSRLPKP